METLEELRAIIAGKPEGAVTIFNNTYIDANNRFYSGGCWFGCNGYLEVNHPTRSLSDIERIIELMELNQNMHTTVAGYLWGKDWAHWNEFNAGKFKL